MLLVGLGNPGPEYALNRHNIGFRVIDSIAHHSSFSSFKRHGAGVFSEKLIQGEKVSLLKPTTYMNRSGIAVSEFASFFKIPLANIVVIHDELDLEFGRLKVKQGGGHGGHNGLKSLDAHIGKDYWRLRIGIGHPGCREDVTSHVLGNFSKSEENSLEGILEAILNNLSFLLKKDMATFMNKISLEL
ncbi:MAG: aminoacyl-tRNA hydrolase [Candidatus Paracaedimonas acanthamoebae]|uniref:Peptidyl-tRNA hydrolase n=1 Tax=Candidatus Paracaedimonas acanthamoebae TaxID=244581 RepID=A0A8J7PQJ6_9PROT|nr:aminoacyl-tRNA hydrolase [Candidatus Paracaedimonas acanthamoebae]